MFFHCFNGLIWAELHKQLNSRRQQGQGWWHWLVIAIWQDCGPVATKMLFFCWNSNQLQIFSAQAQEGNLFFLSARFKSRHLHQTSRHLWLSSSTFWMPLCLPTNFHLKFIGHLAGVIIDTDTIVAKERWWVKQQLNTITEHFCPWNRHVSVNCHPGDVSNH